MLETITNHLVKGEDLNHHGTLFAGRATEWVIESGFLAAADFLGTGSVVCAKVNDIHFYRPIHAGDRVHFVSKIVSAWHSRLLAYVYVTVGEEQKIDGFITFVSVDDQGKSKPHGKLVDATTDDDKKLIKKALKYCEK